MTVASHNNDVTPGNGLVNAPTSIFIVENLSPKQNDLPNLTILLIADRSVFPSITELFDRLASRLVFARFPRETKFFPRKFPSRYNYK